MCCIWNFFCKCKRDIKEIEGVSVCKTDVLHYCDRILICLNSKFDELTQFHLVSVKEKTYQFFFTVLKFFSNVNKALKKVRLSSCRADVLNYCNRL